MPSYFNSWFGLQTSLGASVSDATLSITDGELSVDFAQSTSGWYLLGPEGWSPNSAMFKSSGAYTDSAIAHGQSLKHAVFDNVIESWRVGLNFNSANGLISEIDKLEELLKVRAPRYWQDRQYNQPVYISRSMSGETQTAYALISQGSIVLPDDYWDITCTLGNGQCWPILITFNRQPFWLGAIPGQTQGIVNLSALQDWNYNLAWAEETTLPSGQIFCFVETTSGTIYAGGESEILTWNGSAWAAATTTPVTLSADVQSALVLRDGDILFGENGRIIKLSGGTWSVETTEPTGDVTALLEAEDGTIYAGDDGRILKRVDGTWSEDDDLPSGQVYSLAQTSSGYLFAGEVGRLLRTVDESDPILLYRLSGATGSQDDADETVAGEMTLSFAPNYIFNPDSIAWIGLRFVNVTIAAGARIKTAKLVFKSRASMFSTGGVAEIYCEDTDDASTFTSTDNDISNRTTTSASVTWTNSKVWVNGGFYNSEDFAEVLQEVVDRGGWASGNDVAVLISNTTEGIRRIDNHVYLVVTYVIPAAGGETWEINTTLPAGNVRSLLVTSCGDLLAGDDGQILSTDDEGQSWEVVSTLPSGEIRGLYDAGSNIIYAGDNGQILKSTDCGRNYAVDDTLPTGYVHDFIKETATDDIRAGDDGRILILDDSQTVSLGQSETALDVFVANHHKTANLTNIFQYDDGTGSYNEIFPMSSLPQALYPATPAAGDIVYFIIDTSLGDTGYFHNLAFDIGTPAAATTSYTIVWEYYNGSYTSLTVQDGTSQFSEVGPNVVSWRMPSDMTTDTVNSVTGYVIRARLSALTGTLTNPTQQNRNVYSVNTAFVEMDDAEVEGVVEALAKGEIRCRSDNGGPGGSEPTLYQTRFLMGVKEVTNHENFRAFLNFADEQNPDGVSIDVSVDGDSATSIENDASLSGVTGRRVFFDAGSATLDTMADRVSIVLSTTIARDYYGSYLAFLRCKQTGGSAGQVKVRLKAVSGTGGISTLTEIRATQSTSDHELISFEKPFTLPVSTLFTENDIGDETSITVQIETASASADLYLYDIFLLPTDVMWVESEDTANNNESAVENGTRLVVDSITIPKIPVRSLVQKSGTGLAKANYAIDSNGQFTLLRGRQQRVWFLSARRSSVGGTVWISEPENVYSVKLWKTERWLLGRGLG